MDMPSLFADIIVPIVAILAFLLSLYNAYTQWRRDRPNIYLEISYQKDAFDPMWDGIVPYDGYVIHAKNHGHSDLIIAKVGFKWQDKIFERDYSSITDKGEYTQYEGLPFLLAPGKKLFVEIFRKEMNNEILKSGISGIVKVTCFIKEGNGRFYTTTPIEIDTSKT